MPSVIGRLGLKREKMAHPTSTGTAVITEASSLALMKDISLSLFYLLRFERAGFYVSRLQGRIVNSENYTRVDCEHLSQPQTYENISSNAKDV